MKLYQVTRTVEEVCFIRANSGKDAVREAQTHAGIIWIDPETSYEAEEAAE